LSIGQRNRVSRIIKKFVAQAKKACATLLVIKLPIA
jgi:hypothetical protein